MNYIVSAQGGLYCFYGQGGGLFWREYVHEAWSPPAPLKQNSVANFTVSLCGDKILIVCQGDTWVEQIDFNKGKATASQLVWGGLDGRYYGVPFEDETFLVHNIPIGGEQSQILMSHRVSPKGLWSDSRHLGRFTPFEDDNPFHVAPVSGQHMLLFYQSGTNLGYREIYGRKMGDFNIIHQNTAINGQACSFLSTTRAAHMVYMTKNLLSPSLIYRRRDENGLSAKITIASGHGIHSPVLYIANDRPHLLYMHQNDIYTCGFDGADGLAITPPSKYEGQRAQNLTRCKFLQETDKGFAANELLVDAQNPWDIQILKNFITPSRPKENRILHAAQIGSQKDYDNFFDNWHE
ncbi:MAG: hypothetical protein FWC67_01860 [Defluviitaleaceae bacterium]|nr:hypothetical protein [Defluviitaleaceae bacterium]